MACAFAKNSKRYYMKRVLSTGLLTKEHIRELINECNMKQQRHLTDTQRPVRGDLEGDGDSGESFFMPFNVR